MAPIVIASVVEGDGEVRELPSLLHRIAQELGVYDLQTPKPMRVPRTQLVSAGALNGLFSYKRSGCRANRVACW